MRSKRLLALTLTGMLFFATGCSQMQFIASGKEFKSICEDNGLKVTDITDALSEENGYTGLNSAYTAVPDSGAFTVNYASFSSSKEAESYYSSIADQMDGVEYSGTNYKAEVETVGDTVREIYMESGRIVYAEGDKEEVNKTDSQLMSGWSKPGKVTDTSDASSSEASTEADTEADEETASDEASTAATTKESSSSGSTAKTSSSTAADTSSTKEASAGADTGTQVTVVDSAS